MATRCFFIGRESGSARVAEDDLSNAALKSLASSASAPRRVAFSAASLTRLAEIGAGEAGRVGGDVTQIDVEAERFAPGVHFEDGKPRVACGAVDDHTAIETAWAEQRGIGEGAHRAGWSRPERW